MQPARNRTKQVGHYKFSRHIRYRTKRSPVVLVQIAWIAKPARAVGAFQRLKSGVRSNVNFQSILSSVQLAAKLARMLAWLLRQLHRPILAGQMMVRIHTDQARTGHFVAQHFVVTLVRVNQVDIQFLKGIVAAVWLAASFRKNTGTTVQKWIAVQLLTLAVLMQNVQFVQRPDEIVALLHLSLLDQQTGRMLRVVAAIGEVQEAIAMVQQVANVMADQAAAHAANPAQAVVQTVVQSETVEATTAQIAGGQTAKRQTGQISQRLAAVAGGQGVFTSAGKTIVAVWLFQDYLLTFGQIAIG